MRVFRRSERYPDRDQALRPEVLAAYVEGEVTPSQATAIDAALAESPRARREVAEMRALRAVLSQPLPEIESIDVVGRLQDAIARADAGATAPQPSSVAARWRARWGSLGWVAGVAGAVAVTLVALVLFPRSGRSPDDGEFRAKSAAPASAPARTDGQRWAGVQVYRATGPAASEPLGAQLGAGDGLLFAYTNLGPRPFGYLMIFAIDARGAVRWYHPAYERAGSNPTSLPLRAAVARVALPDVIRHDLAPGPLEIRALFTRQSVSVLDVEAWVAAHAGAVAPPPWPGAFQQVIEARVEGDDPR